MKRYLTGMLVILITAIVPLFFDKAYYNMTQAKWLIFAIIGTILLLLFGSVVLVRRITKKDEGRICVDSVDKAVISFSIIALLSSILSGEFIISFFGIEGWCIGSFTIVTLALIYLILSRQQIEKEWVIKLALLVNIGIFIISVLHSADIDFLGMHNGIYPAQRYWYISTIGNINWFSGYLCILIPFVFMIYLGNESRKKDILMNIYIGLAILNAILCASDSILIGMGVFVMILIPWLVKHADQVRYVGIWVFWCGLCIIAVAGLPAFDNWQDSLNGIFDDIVSIPIGLCVSGVGFMLLGVAIWTKPGEKVVRICGYALEGVLVAIVTIMLVTAISSFDDSWGTNRGLIWTTSIDIFGDYSLKEKIIGVGPEMLGDEYAELSTHTERRVLVAHSEYLQVLMTMGIAGLIAWCSIWFAVLRRHIKSKERTLLQTASFCAIASYLAQCTVNVNMITNVAMIVLVLAIYRRQGDDMSGGG